jgi:hypothetical protein
MKNILALLLSVLLIIPINTSYAAETETQPSSETVTDEDNSSDALSIIVILGIFTVTAACSGVLTYKIRRKSNENKSS